MKKSKIVATIEARMTSSRLPGKVLLSAAEKPMLEHLVNRLKMVPSVDRIVLATTVNKTDEVLADFGKKHGISVFRGSEDDVMERVIGAAESVKGEIIVEITGDCPIIDPRIVEQTILTFIHNPCDYASNVQVRSYPVGMDTQVYTLETLKKSFGMTKEKLDHEHVTRHIRLHPEIFPQVHLVSSYDLHWPELGLTLDEHADYELLKKIIEHFGTEKPDFSLQDILQLLRVVHPEWIELNRKVKRKGMNA